MITRIRDFWNQHWFAPDSARNLAVARILAAGTALWVLVSRNRAAISDLGAPFWAGVPGSTRWRYLLFPDHGRLESILVLATVVLLIGALLGVRARVCAFAAALLLYHIAPLESIIWTPSPEARGLTLPALALLLCGIAPSADALAPGAAHPRARSWIYGWPLRLLQLWLAAVYVFSGIGKLRMSGLAWSSWSSMSNWMYLATQNELVAVHHGLGNFIAARPLAAGLAGTGTIVFELAMVIAVFSKRWRPWLAILALAFHLGIYFAMNITVNSWPLLLTCFDWDRRDVRA